LCYLWSGNCGGNFADFGLAFLGNYGIMLCLSGRKIFGEDFFGNKEGAAL
jgi:hypothetical protein